MYVCTYRVIVLYKTMETLAKPRDDILISEMEINIKYSMISGVIILKTFIYHCLIVFNNNIFVKIYIP